MSLSLCQPFFGCFHRYTTVSISVGRTRGRRWCELGKCELFRCCSWNHSFFFVCTKPTPTHSPSRSLPTVICRHIHTEIMIIMSCRDECVRDKLLFSLSIFNFNQYVHCWCLLHVASYFMFFFRYRYRFAPGNRSRNGWIIYGGKCENELLSRSFAWRNFTNDTWRRENFIKFWVFVFRWTFLSFSFFSAQFWIANFL